MSTVACQNRQLARPFSIGATALTCALLFGLLHRLQHGGRKGRLKVKRNKGKILLVYTQPS